MTSTSVVDTYLGFLDTSDNATDKEPLPTPRIDTVLESYRQKASSTDDGSGCALKQPDYEGRLLQLEKQLTSLLHKTKARPYRGSQQKPRTLNDSDSTPSVEEEITHADTLASSSTSRPSKSSKINNISKPIMSASTIHHTRKTPSLVGVTNHGSKRAPSKHVTTTTEDQRTKERLLKNPGPKTMKSQQAAIQQDLDKERERRWKAEQAAERLVEHVRTLQTKLADVQAKHELCVVQNSRLNSKMTGANQNKETLKSQLDELRGQLEDSNTELDKMHTRDAEQMDLLRRLEENCRSLETEKIKDLTELSSRTKEAERIAAGCAREVELLTKSVRHLKAQLHQTQELLANREREHQKQMENCKPLESKELQELISKEVATERARMDALVEQYKEKISEHQKSYRNLEDEFRMALRIETGRFQELHRTYQQVSGDVESSRETAIAAVQKEQKANAMILELTSLAKEQKGRIGELGRSKQEAVTQFKDRITLLEDKVANKHKLEVKLQSLQEEKGRLLSRVQAQESVIDGLREERQLWGRELAHQGATLAQDRGRMEAQLQGLSEEVKSTREQLQREREAVRIKEKQVEDQLGSIQDLKQALSSREQESHSLQLDSRREQQSLQLQLEQEQAENHDLQEQVSGLLERKDSLKEELADCQEKLEQWKSKYNKLKVQWEEKVVVLGGLEESMGKLQESFLQREATLVREKEAALEELRLCQQRLRTCDDAFRDQLDAKQRSHDQHVTRIIAEKDRDIQLAQQRVTGVEHEMRELLSEVAREKRSMEAKFQKLLRAFQEVRLDSSE